MLGYALWVVLGVLCAAAGFFHPIDLDGFLRAAAVILFIVSVFLSGSTGNGTGFMVTIGFGGFLVAMYCLGFAIPLALFGWIIIAGIVAAILFAIGTLTVVCS